MKRLARGKFRPLLFLAQSSMAPYTWAEAKQILEPIGMDRWSDELFLKYGIRDAFSCPVAGRWVVVFWSRKDLSKVLERQTRNMIFAAASFSALRLEQLTRPDFARYREAYSVDASRNRRLAFDLHRVPDTAKQQRHSGLVKRRSAAT